MEDYMQITYKKLASYSLYLYILTLYVLAYSAKLNFISKGLFVVTLFTFLLYIYKSKSIAPGPVYIFAFAFAFYVTISSFWSIDISYSVMRNITIYQVIILMIVAYNLLTTREDLDNIIQCLFWGGFLMCLYAIVYYGPGEIIHRMQVGLRVGDEINQENGFGIYCVISYLIGMFNVVYKKKNMYIAPTLICLILSFASGSRRSLLVLIVVTALLFAMKDGKIKISKTFIYAVLLFIVIFILSKLEMFENLFVRFTALLDSLSEDQVKVDNSFATRKEMIAIGLENFIKKPVFGYGTAQYGVLFATKYGAYRVSHNNFIELLVNYGLVGFFIYYSGIVFCIKNLLSGFRRSESIAVIIFLVYCVELVGHIAMISINNKFSYIYLAIIFAYGNIIKQEKNKIS